MKNKIIHIKQISTPIGNLFLFSDGEALIQVSQFDHTDKSILSKIKFQTEQTENKKSLKKIKNKTISQETVFEFKNDAILNSAEKQFKEYFNKKRITFDLPVKNSGTNFQEKVWKKISQIKYGKTDSYQGVSIKIKHPEANRATASACSQNNIPIVVPCHRVIGKSGTLNGYSLGIKAKEFLLKHEGFLK